MQETLSRSESVLVDSSQSEVEFTHQGALHEEIEVQQGIVRILKRVEAGAKVAETCRKHGISEPTYHVWKTKYAGMEVLQLRHLKDVEVELARLKRMYADLTLERHALKDNPATALACCLTRRCSQGASARPAVGGFTWP